jgi:HAD superfamily hydrolase (TIGR01549 family)
MDEVKIVSFDVEGTLVTTDFSYAIWFEAIPRRYAEKNGIDLEQARKAVEEEYRKVGDQRLEWYDIRYWFDRLGLGTPAAVMQGCQNRVGYYPEVKEVLVSLAERYKLIAASGSSGDFLQYLLKDIRTYFSDVYSSITDYQQLKTPEFYIQICRTLQVEPGQIVHIGDNWQFDFVAPSQIGIRAFHLDRKSQLNNQNSMTNLSELKTRLLQNQL